ncbi:MAG: FHA domain-containing protein, partial [Bdellovibrionales bacterium]|nr:FHA domain-containing protein [Bdellovibrionales bacterium]
MKLLYRLITVCAQGQKDLHDEYLEGDSIVAGRGGSSSLLLEGRSISLEHAKFQIHEGKLVVSDLGSLSGVQVNGAVVSSRILKKGDEVKLGGARLTVLNESGQWGLAREKIASKEHESDSVAKVLSRLSVSSVLPSMKLISWLVAAIVA